MDISKLPIDGSTEKIRVEDNGANNDVLSELLHEGTIDAESAPVTTISLALTGPEDGTEGYSRITINTALDSLKERGNFRTCQLPWKRADEHFVTDHFMTPTSSVRKEKDPITELEFTVPERVVVDHGPKLQAVI